MPRRFPIRPLARAVVPAPLRRRFRAIVNRLRTSEAPRPLAPPPPAGSDAQAVVFRGIRQVELLSVAMPPVGEWDVTVATEVSGISVGTERWALLGLRPDVQYPCVPGYLGVGRVSDVGASAATLGFTRGQRLLTLASRPPLGCEGNWMAAHLSRGIFDANPATVSPETDLPYLLPIPESVSSLDAVFAGLAAVPLMGLDMAQVVPGETLAVFGLNLVGQFAVQLAVARGARVFAADLVGSRAEAAVRHGGAAATSHGEALPSGQDPMAALAAAAREFAPGGFDVIMDTTGNAAAVNAQAPLLRPHGRLVLQGWYPGLAALDVHALHVRYSRLFCPCGMRGGDVSACLALMAEGKLRAEPLITHRWRPDEASAAYDGVANGDSAALAQVFEWPAHSAPLSSR